MDFRQFLKKKSIADSRNAENILDKHWGSTSTG